MHRHMNGIWHILWKYLLFFLCYLLSLSLSLSAWIEKTYVHIVQHNIILLWKMLRIFDQQPIFQYSDLVSFETILLLVVHWPWSLLFWIMSGQIFIHFLLKSPHIVDEQCDQKPYIEIDFAFFEYEFVYTRIHVQIILLTGVRMKNL